MCLRDLWEEVRRRGSRLCRRDFRYPFCWWSSRICLIGHSENVIPMIRPTLYTRPLPLQIARPTERTCTISHVEKKVHLASYHSRVGRPHHVVVSANLFTCGVSWADVWVIKCIKFPHLETPASRAWDVFPASLWRFPRLPSPIRRRRSLPR